ncbi:ABC transporter permease [Streptomyces sp. NPDC003781]|uniref:ABC transporter permease n=1 Tax=Streptomyces sp. NPDC003781 TaxID=3364686 RepID=UPI0036BA96DE
MSAPAPAPARPPLPAARTMLVVIVMVPVAIAVALWAFAWPNARIAPHDLPVGVAGPAAAAAPLQQQLEGQDGAFEVHRYDDESAARGAIENRHVYGAVVVTPQGPKLLTASAAGPVVAQLLSSAVAHQAPAGSRLQTVDVVAAPEADPRGSVLGSSALPLALAGVAAGSLVTLLGLRGVRAATALVGAAALVGLAAAAIADSWLGVLTGNWWAEAGALGLMALAAGAAVAGFAALLGRAGIGVGALLVVLLGNPWSGVTSAPELLPEPVGAIGQLLPPGAGGTLLRSVAFFDGSGAGTPIVTLGTWAVLGLLVVTLAGLRGRKTPAAGEQHPAPSPAPVS